MNGWVVQSFLCLVQVLANVHTKLDIVVSKNRALLESLNVARDEVRCCLPARFDFLRVCVPWHCIVVLSDSLGH